MLSVLFMWLHSRAPWLQHLRSPHGLCLHVVSHPPHVSPHGLFLSSKIPGLPHNMIDGFQESRNGSSQASSSLVSELITSATFYLKENCPDSRRGKRFHFLIKSTTCMYRKWWNYLPLSLDLWD